MGAPAAQFEAKLVPYGVSETGVRVRLQKMGEERFMEVVEAQSAMQPLATLALGAAAQVEPVGEGEPIAGRRGPGAEGCLAESLATLAHVAVARGVPPGRRPASPRSASSRAPDAPPRHTLTRSGAILKPPPR